MERETRIELATNSLEGCDSTIELLPLFLVLDESSSTAPSEGRFRTRPRYHRVLLRSATPARSDIRARGESHYFRTKILRETAQVLEAGRQALFPNIEWTEVPNHRFSQVAEIGGFHVHHFSMCARCERNELLLGKRTVDVDGHSSQCG